MRPLNKSLSSPFYGAGEDEDYDIYRRRLVEATGAYCAYCEAPVSVDMPIEHKAAKFNAKSGTPPKYFYVNNDQFLDVGYAQYAAQWRNLLLACNSCNTIKSAQPGQKEAREYLFQYSSATAYKTNNLEQLYMAALAWSIWPDRCPDPPEQPAPPVDETYRLITFDYSSRSQQQLADLDWLPPLPQDASWADDVYTQVWVMPNEDYIEEALQDDLETHFRVLNMIKMVKLNYYVEDARANDRRTENRTNVYLKALDAVNDLATVVSSVGLNSPDVVVMVQSIREAALATGYWSVWMWVFTNAFQDTSNDVWKAITTADKQKLLNYLFLIYMPGERAAGDGETLFPGTDLTRIPALT